VYSLFSGQGNFSCSPVDLTYLVLHAQQQRNNNYSVVGIMGCQSTGKVRSTYTRKEQLMSHAGSSPPFFLSPFGCSFNEPLTPHVIGFW